MIEVHPLLYEDLPDEQRLAVTFDSEDACELPDYMP